MQSLIRYGLLVMLCAPWPAAAQWSPKQPIRLVVPAAAGGGHDVAGTPQDAVRRIHSVIIDTIKQPENQQALIAQGTEPWTSTSPEEFADFIRQEVTRFSQILKQAGVQPR